jgi:hypothetical protein
MTTNEIKKKKLPLFAMQLMAMGLLVTSAYTASLPPPPGGPPAPILTGISASGPTLVDEETSEQYTCVGSYSDGTTALVNAIWSEDSAYATINGSGLLTAGNVAADQAVNVTATYGGFTKTVAATIAYVVPLLDTISISGTSSMNEETTEQFTCTANYSDGTTALVSASWSENSAFASINTSGLLTAGNVASDQNVTVTAEFDGKTAGKVVMVKYVAPNLAGITISGPTSLNEETTAQYSCVASYSDGTSTTVSPNWTDNSSKASISSSGLLSAGDVSADQSLTITASFGGRSDTYGVSIKYVQPTVAGITITGPVSLDEETFAQFVCTASYSDGTSGSVTPSWNENSVFASINGSGLLSAGDIDSDQNVTISATYEGQSDTHSVVMNYVTPPVVLTSIAISGPNSMDENSTAQYSCMALYSDGSSTAVVPVWSENSAFSTIDTAGLLSAGNVAVDETMTLTADFDGESSTYAVDVMAIGTQVIFPLSGFVGQTVYAELYDYTSDTWITLSEEFEPKEMVIENVILDQWYWLGLNVYDEVNGEPVIVYGGWIRM